MLQEKTSYKPFLVAWNLTRECNLHCQHCYIDAGGFSGERVLTELTREEGLSLIDDIASVNPETILVLTGGEPLLYHYTLDFARYASRKGLMVVVGTNGILLDDPMVKRLMDSGVSGVGISLDSTDPSIHDTFRGVPGAWRRAVEAIERCRSHGLQFQIHHSVMSFNWGDVWQMVEFAHYQGAKVVNFFFMVCTGRGERLTDITPEQYEEVLSTLIDLQAKYPDMLIRARCAPHFKRIAYQKDPHSPITKAEGYLGGGCLAGAHYCRIAPDGVVTPCPYMPLSVGNVRYGRFSEIWENSPVFKDLRSLQIKGQLKGKCGECEFEILCGGCRARPYASHGDYLDEDLWCQYIPQGGEKIGVAQMKEDTKMTWTAEAEVRLNRLPFFLRSMIKGKVEKYAEENKIYTITPELLDELRRRRFGDKMPDISPPPYPSPDTQSWGERQGGGGAGVIAVSRSPERSEGGTKAVGPDRATLSEAEKSQKENFPLRSMQALPSGTASPRNDKKGGDEQGQGQANLLPWTKEAMRRLDSIPEFMKGIFREVAEDVARERGHLEVNVEVWDRLDQILAEDEPVKGVEWTEDALRQIESRYADKPSFAKGFIVEIMKEDIEREAVKQGFTCIDKKILMTLEKMGKGSVEWTPEAWQRLQKAPDFIRSGIRKAAERRARRIGISPITSELLTQFRNMAMMKAVKRIKALGYSELTFDAFDEAKEKFKNIKESREAQERLDDIKEYVTSKGKIGLIDEEMLKKMKEYLKGKR